MHQSKADLRLRLKGGPRLQRFYRRLQCIIILVWPGTFPTPLRFAQAKIPFAP